MIGIGRRLEQQATQVKQLLLQHQNWLVLQGFSKVLANASESLQWMLNGSHESRVSYFRCIIPYRLRPYSREKLSQEHNVKSPVDGKKGQSDMCAGHGLRKDDSLPSETSCVQI